MSGYTTQFMPVSFLFEEIAAHRTSGKYLSFLKKLIFNKLAKLDVLICDDFGLRSYTHSEATFLQALLESRQSAGVQIVTSQVDPKGWKGLFEDPIITHTYDDCNISNYEYIPSYHFKRRILSREVNS